MTGNYEQLTDFPDKVSDEVEPLLSHTKKHIFPL